VVKVPDTGDAEVVRRKLEQWYRAEAPAILFSDWNITPTTWGWR